MCLVTSEKVYIPYIRAHKMAQAGLKNKTNKDACVSETACVCVRRYVQVCLACLLCVCLHLIYTPTFFTPPPCTLCSIMKSAFSFFSHSFTLALSDRT